MRKYPHRYFYSLLLACITLGALGMEPGERESSGALRKEENKNEGKILSYLQDYLLKEMPSLQPFATIYHVDGYDLSLDGSTLLLRFGEDVFKLYDTRMFHLPCIGNLKKDWNGIRYKVIFDESNSEERRLIWEEQSFKADYVRSLGFFNSLNFSHDTLMRLTYQRSKGEEVYKVYDDAQQLVIGKIIPSDDPGEAELVKGKIVMFTRHWSLFDDDPNRLVMYDANSSNLYGFLQQFVGVGTDDFSPKKIQAYFIAKVLNYILLMRREAREGIQNHEWSKVQEECGQKWDKIVSQQYDKDKDGRLTRELPKLELTPENLAIYREFFPQSIRQCLDPMISEEEFFMAPSSPISEHFLQEMLPLKSVIRINDCGEKFFRLNDLTVLRPTKSNFKVYDVETWQERAVLPRGSRFNGFKLSSDGSIIVIETDKNFVSYEVKTWNELARIPRFRNRCGFELSDDGSIIVIDSKTKGLGFYDVETGKKFPLKLKHFNYDNYELSGDGSIVVTKTNNYTVSYDVKTGNQIECIPSSPLISEEEYFTAPSNPVKELLDECLVKAEG